MDDQLLFLKLSNNCWVIKMANQYPPWTEEKTGILKELYPGRPKEEIQKKTNRTWFSIKTRASRLKLIRKYRWTNRKLPRLNIKKEDAIWLACAIDAEGTISLRKTYKTGLLQPIASIKNTSKEFIHKFQTLSDTGHHTSKENPPNRKPVYRVEFSRTSFVYAFLIKIKPYLVIKKRHAKLILEFIKLQRKNLIEKKSNFDRVNYTPRQHEIFKEIRLLNGHRCL